MVPRIAIHQYAKFKLCKVWLSSSDNLIMNEVYKSNLTHSFHFQFDSSTSCIKLSGRYKCHLMVVIASWTISKDNLWSWVSLYTTLTFYSNTYVQVCLLTVKHRLKGCRIKIKFGRCSSSLCSSLRDLSIANQLKYFSPTDAHGKTFFLDFCILWITVYLQGAIV